MEQWKPQDSGKIQLASLTKFMQVLGYSYMMPTHSFESGLWVNRGRQYVSFNTAVKLYNGTLTDWHGNRFHDGCFALFPEGWFEAARKAKILLRVKLQYSRKKGVIVQDHRVKFVHPEQADLFFKDE
jgi:hypothetical protein